MQGSVRGHPGGAAARHGAEHVLADAWTQRVAHWSVRPDARSPRSVRSPVILRGFLAGRGVGVGFGVGVSVGGGRAAVGAWPSVLARSVGWPLLHLLPLVAGKWAVRTA